MLDKLKQLAELRNLEGAMKRERAEAEVRGVTVTLNGSFEAEEIHLNPDLAIKEQEDAVREALNTAVGRLRSAVAQKLSGLMR